MIRALLFAAAFVCGLPSLAAQTPVADTKFTPRRGFHDAPFTLTISSATPGAEIRYTTDGSTPTATTGTIYAAPIQIGTTTVVRALATAPGLDPTNVDTHTYLFLADVVNQPSNITGYPRNTYPTGGGPNVQMDYQMDPIITDDPAYSADLLTGLQEIPSLCISVDPDNIYGNSNFYDGDAEEQISVETLFFNSPADNEQSEAGIESHSHKRMKRSMRLNFRSEYGDSKWRTKLLRDAPFNSNNRATPNELDRVILRAGNNRAWSRGWSEEKTTYAIDEFARQTQISMGDDGMRGAFVHLYINGLYWGLFNPVHRADTFFTSETYGGEEADWFAVSHGGDIPAEGNNSPRDDRYDYLKGTLKNKDMSVAANYAELEEHLDIENFIDYLLLHWYTTTGDWPQNNWYGGLRNPTSPEGPTPMKFFAWDGEWSWDLPHSSIRTRVPRDAAPWVHIDFRKDEGKNKNRPIADLFNSAKDNPDFLRRLGDRAHRHLANDGVLTDANAQARFSSTTDYIENAVIAESARWGDTIVSTPFTRDDHWQPEVTDILGYMNGRAAQLIAALRTENYYPDFDPPSYNQHGGEITSGFTLSLTNPNSTGSLHLSLDGSDPADGGGFTYTAPIALTETTRALARVKQGNEWSALTEATFIIPSPADLHLTELHYHPAAPDSATEFLELTNTGTTPLDLAGYTFTTGITLTFPAPTMLAAGETAVIVRDTDLFQAKYGTSIRILGEYAGKLSNDGERLALVTDLGQTIFDFTYNDTWHRQTDGAGDSLEPGTQPPSSEATDWGPSHLPGGSPAATEIAYATWAAAQGFPTTPDPTQDSNGDGITDLIEFVFGGTPLVQITPSGITFSLRRNREDITVTPQLSTDLTTWPDQALPPSTNVGVFTEYQIPAASAARSFFRMEVTIDN